ncbi:MAG: hypothetical protein H5T69_06585 [Chloroflexi bacterium]|nr:hypothetical protein [Chloroflexota bacterium]
MKRKSQKRGREADKRRELWLSIGAFALFILVGMLLLAVLGKAFPRQRSAGPVAWEFILLHTNDTWGYVEPCG